MRNLFKKFKAWLNLNPYEEEYYKRVAFLNKYPATPNLAKLAYYCGCEVSDIIEEIEWATGRIRVKGKEK